MGVWFWRFGLIVEIHLTLETPVSPYRCNTKTEVGLV